MANTREKLPEVKHLYQNHAMDSTRWNFFAPRANDIVVATSIRAGTTWTLAIVGNLISSGQELPGPIDDISPFLERRNFPLEVMLTALERQTHRR